MAVADRDRLLGTQPASTECKLDLLGFNLWLSPVV